MSQQPAKKLATIEDLLALIATGERAELIEGEIVYKAAPSSRPGGIRPLSMVFSGANKSDLIRPANSSFSTALLVLPARGTALA